MNLRDFLREHGVSFRQHGEHHHATQRFIQVDCPYCSPEAHSFRMGLALSGTHSVCWKCGSHPIAETLHRVTGVRWKTLKDLLGNLPNTKYAARPRGKLEIPYGVGPLLKLHKRYLKGRGFDPEALEQLWGLKGIGISHELPWRIWIPIHHYGEVVSWTTRSIVDEGLRYLTAEPHQERLNHKELLFGQDFATHTIIICEGSLDAIAVGPGAVAILGLNVSRAQFLAMSKFVRRVVCFDNEVKAQVRAEKLCRELEVFPGETYRVELTHKDAAETLKKKPKELESLRDRFLR